MGEIKGIGNEEPKILTPKKLRSAALEKFKEDWRKVVQENTNPIPVLSSGKIEWIDINKVRFCKKCGAKLLENTCKKCGKYNIKS